jgi:ABC-type Mn2+/Zn2+ transport system ATPase subunit
MPRFEHVVEATYSPTFRTEKVAGMFDVPVAEKLRRSWSVDMPTESVDWNIGLIVGASGTGKTTIAKRAFGENAYFSGHTWQKPNMLDDFDETLDVKTITDALSHVGFSSPPAWLLPYHCLSNGQKFRADLARVILEKKGVVVFDEFTSLVDRTVAKIGSAAIAKFIRKQNRQFVAVTCHYDVKDWLAADWVYDVSTETFVRGELRRPSIEITVQRVHHSAWALFRGHHYLSADINKAAKVYVASWGETPVALCAILPFPHPKVKNAWREHRTVVLPDYQGVGIGNKLAEFVGELVRSEGKRYMSTTSHPAMIHYRAKSTKWIMTRGPSRLLAPGGKAKTQNNKNTSINRLTASFEYVGNSAGKNNATS